LLRRRSRRSAARAVQPGGKRYLAPPFLAFHAQLLPRRLAEHGERDEIVASVHERRTTATTKAAASTTGAATEGLQALGDLAGRPTATGVRRSATRPQQCRQRVR